MADETHAALVALSDTDLTVQPEDDVRGRPVFDRHDERIGDVDDLVIDEEERRVRFLQVGSGGFLGIGEEKRLVPVDAVSRVEDNVHIDKTREDVAGSPAYDPEVVRASAEDYYAGLYSYYGFAPFWGWGYAYPGFPRGGPGAI
ncbi:hypothetical protein GCM10023169_29350 [Georgenia halophila]|uniref:PRC-barrel domain-containing protein n=1 Tax=Georgenia halophila TaxID=620889 RepID=A0ABP8LET3_9MICO